MKARMPAGFGRPDVNALMRQAQKMQEDMKAKQAELEAAEYTGSAAGEMVTVKMNGNMKAAMSITALLKTFFIFYINILLLICLFLCFNHFL